MQGLVKQDDAGRYRSAGKMSFECRVIRGDDQLRQFVMRVSGPWKTSGEWWTKGWDRDEWDVALSDGGAYRVFLDRAAGRWFIDAILD